MLERELYTTFAKELATYLRGECHSRKWELSELKYEDKQGKLLVDTGMLRLNADQRARVRSIARTHVPTFFKLDFEFRPI